MTIPFRARKLNTVSGFIDEWEQLKGMGASGPYAYKLLEDEYFEYFGSHRYADYSSFYQTFIYRRKKEINARKTT